MIVEQLYPSEFIEYQPDFQRSQLILPFFDSHEQGRREFLQAIKRQEAWWIKTGSHQFFLQCIVEAETLMLKNLLFFGESVTWKEASNAVEVFAKKRFLQKIHLPVELDRAFQQWLQAEGYVPNSDGMTKQCCYHTALVLGGGGAHGAYQIGVWQALEEEGLTFELITGTSVGALNGGLILQGDWEAAKNLWLQINTGSVLQFPAAAIENQSLSALLSQIRSLTLTALKENGASTEPLKELIQQNFSADKCQENPPRLLVCSTRLTDFKEVVQEIDLQDLSTSIDWLIASASFYPAMKTKEIAGELYMDGGYRNNLPIDVAIQEGATECIVVDVQSPGPAKKMEVPENIPIIHLHSKWTLGSFLVFDAERSQRNYQLGYYETKKYFAHYQGGWYTFFKEETINEDWQAFCRKIRNEPQLWQIIKGKDFWQRMRKSYKDKVTYETAGIALMEWAGVTLSLDPTRVYTKAGFCREIIAAIEHHEPRTGAYSVPEWLKMYRERWFVLSDVNLLSYCYRLFDAENTEMPYILFERSLIPLIAARFMIYLIKGE